MDNNFSSRDRDTLYREWTRRFWEAKRANAEREKALAEGTWFREPVPGEPKLGTW